MLNELASWWLRQMRELLPERLRQRAAGPANAVVFAWHETAGIQLLVRRDHKETSLGRFGLDEAGLRMARTMLGSRRRPAIVLRLPPGMLLERQVTLPLAAEQGLDRVVRYEMDRFTPFTVNEVFYAYSIQRRDQARSRIVIGIVLVPRARLASVLETMRQLQLTPTMLEAAGSSGELQQIPLASAASGKLRWRGRGLVVAGVTCAALAVAAVVLPFWRQAQARDAVEARIAAFKPQLDEVEAVRKRLAAVSESADVFTAEHARVGDALHAIATLTELLPDDTHLISLVMQKREVSLQGESAAAAKLLTTLSADPTIRNAAFTAPVTRNAAGDDVFAIRVEIVP
jgi:general secretion pathway protein L